MKSNNIKTLSAVGLFFIMQSTFAGNITNINVSTLPNNQKIIKVSFDRDVVQPSGFVTSNPDRIALDFANTSIRLAKPVLKYSDPLLNQIVAAQNNDRARILLDLNKSGKYDSQIKGNQVWIYISQSGSQDLVRPQVNEVVPTAVQSNVISRNIVTTLDKQDKSTFSGKADANINFRKGTGSSGIVELDALSFSGEPDVKRQSDRVIITLKNYPLSIQAQRSLDVSDFSTPIRNVTMRRLGNDTQVVIKNQGSWDIKTQSANGRFSFEVAPKTTATTQGIGDAVKHNFNGRRISLDFQDVDVRTILQILAKESGMNIVASDSVTGKMTLTLKDVPWDQALDLVMQARNLDMRRQGNIINVAPRQELLAKDKSILESQKEIEELGPLYSQTFQLKYKNVQEFKKILNIDENGNVNSNSNNTLLSSRGSALIDPSTNTLIITDNSNVIQKFQKLITELDVPARQVMVEARIVEADDGFARDIGVKFGYQGVKGRSIWGSGIGGGGANEGFINPNVNLPVSSPVFNISLVRKFSSDALGLELSAMQEENKGKIISNPRVLTQDRKEAVIESGSEIPYEESTSSGATSITFKKAVLGLTVTPNITPDGKIIMNINITKDSPTNCVSSGVTTLCINTKKLQTQAMVEDGGTLIVGGIYEEENSNTVNKVPLLGDIPVVGNLFKSQGRKQARRELLIFITPRIMDGTGSTLRY